MGALGINRGSGFLLFTDTGLVRWSLRPSELASGVFIPEQLFCSVSSFIDIRGMFLHTCSRHVVSPEGAISTSADSESSDSLHASFK